MFILRQYKTPDFRISHIKLMSSKFADLLVQNLRFLFLSFHGNLTGVQLKTLILKDIRLKLNIDFRYTFECIFAEQTLCILAPITNPVKALGKDLSKYKQEDRLLTLFVTLFLTYIIVQYPTTECSC